MSVGTSSGLRCWQRALQLQRAAHNKGAECDVGRVVWGVARFAGGKQVTVVRQLDNLEAAGDSSGAIRQPGAAGNRKIMVEIATVEMVVMGEIATVMMC